MPPKTAFTARNDRSSGAPVAGISSPAMIMDCA